MFRNQLEQAQNRCPLLIGTSGGIGCNIAIHSIAESIKDQTPGVTIPIYTPKLLKDKKFNWISFGLWTASILMHDIPIISYLLNKITNALHKPILPKRKKLLEEMHAIESSQKQADGTPKDRNYIDFLLDTNQSGYMYVAIYNVLHKQFNIKQAKNMVDQQTAFEKRSYKNVKKYFLNLLEEARKKGNPYSEIITTQMVSLDAIIDAAQEYNNLYHTNIQVHLYMSDFFTKKSQHYMQPLERLTKKQRGLLNLHGMNMQEEKPSLGNISEFAAREEIDPHNNPMIRKGFRQAYNLSAQELSFLTIQSHQNTKTIEESYPITSQEKIATIMLSSVGCDDSITYAQYIANYMPQGKRAYDKIFVFCGNNTELKRKLQNLNKELIGKQKLLNHSEPSNIIILDQQDAEHTAKLLQRSDLTILRGGMVLMEEMALQHHIEQQYFFHNSQNADGSLTTGLAWEDGSIDHFITYLGKTHQIKAQKGTLDHFLSDLYKDDHTNTITYTLEEIKKTLQRISEDDTRFSASFCSKVKQLFHEAQQDIEQQLKDKKSIATIHQSVSYQIAQETMIFLNRFAYYYDKPNKKTKIIDILRDYDEACYKIAHASPLIKSAALLISAVFGFTLGIIIGGGLGILIGLWTGPGALITALTGIFSGAITGTSAGLMLVASTSGIATAITAKNKSAFFKHNPVECKAKELIKLSIEESNNALSFGA